MSTLIAERNDLDLKHSNLDGDLMLPGWPGYDASRALWNGMIDRRPSVIIRPKSTADIQRAIAFARELDLPLSIKSGGHNVAGHAVTDGGVMLDMSALRGVAVDPAARTARVQGGATWADFDGATAQYGLATTGGAISSTGVAGLTLGGGIGWLVGKHGLTVDNLLSVELVTADGALVTASGNENEDLFWALRGGGGNFGVVTNFELGLHPLDLVLAGKVAYPIDQAREALEFYRDFTASAPDELTVYCSVMTEPERGLRIIAFAFCWSGELGEGERVLEPLLRFGSPLVRMVLPMPYAEWQSANDPNFPYGRRYYWKGAMASELKDEVLDAIVEQASHPPLPWLRVMIEFYEGAMNRVPVSGTAFPHRDARYQIVSIGAWDDPADDETGRSWTRAMHAAVSPHTLDGAFLNFNSTDSDERGERTRASFGANWGRLVEVKRRYDPGNFFRQNNNIAV